MKILVSRNRRRTPRRWTVMEIPWLGGHPLARGLTLTLRIGGLSFHFCYWALMITYLAVFPTWNTRVYYIITAYRMFSPYSPLPTACWHITSTYFIVNVASWKFISAYMDIRLSATKCLQQEVIQPISNKVSRFLVAQTSSCRICIVCMWVFVHVQVCLPYVSLQLLIVHLQHACRCLSSSQKSTYTQRKRGREVN